MRLVAILLVAFAVAGCTRTDAPASSSSPPPATSPYVGQESRELKALSPEEIAGLEAGDGLGYAKSAELNHYPGPKHALDMADALNLTPEQRAKLRELRQEMLDNAVPWGKARIAAEADIEQAFRSGTLDDARLKPLLDKAASIESELRFIHLRAHLATRAVLTPEQAQKYDAMRGYGEASVAHDHKM